MAISKKVINVYLGVMNIEEDLFKKSAQSVEADWNMHGFAGTIYEDYARAVLDKYIISISNK